MSDRDPRYNPIELLINATEADTETAAEWSALYDFQKIAAEWKKEKQKRDNFVRHSASTSTVQPAIQEHLRLQAAASVKRIKQLGSQLQEMSQSEVLEPVVWRAYEKVCAEGAEIVRKKQEAEFQRKLQEISDEYYERKRISAENRKKSQEQFIPQAENNMKLTDIVAPVVTSAKEPPRQKTKPKVFRAIVTAFLTFFVFGAVYLLAYLILAGVIYVLSIIPLINRLVDLLFYWRGDSPDMLLSVLAPTIAYFVTMVVQESVNKNKPTRGLSCIILGILVTLLHIVSIVINLIYGDGILANITQAIAGIVILHNGSVALTKANKD